MFELFDLEQLSLAR